MLIQKMADHCRPIKSCKKRYSNGGIFQTRILDIQKRRRIEGFFRNKMPTILSGLKNNEQTQFNDSNAYHSLNQT